MDILKATIVSAIIGGCFVLSVVIAVNGLTDYKKTGNGGITATGSATRDITSDLISWGGSFSRKASTTKEAYDLLKKDAELVRKYLLDNNVSESDFSFSAVDITQNFIYDYSENGNIIGQYSDGYTLTQSLNVGSYEVDKIESISRDITNLIDSGVGFFSRSPEYYYTKLDELKLEMISQATENARTRGEIVAENAKSNLGNLVNANLGVFQITAQNSSADEYSSGGTYNTWSKNKTASVTVKLYYEVKN